jgi:hypothetical protein
MSKSALSSEYLSEFGDSRITQNCLEHTSTFEDTVSQNAMEDEWNVKSSRKNLSLKKAFSITKESPKETQEAPKSAFDLLLLGSNRNEDQISESPHDKKNSKQNSLSTVKSPKHQTAIEKDSIEHSSLQSSKKTNVDMKLRPSATTVILEDLKDYLEAENEDKASYSKNKTSPQRSPSTKKHVKLISEGRDNEELSSTDFSQSHKQKLKSKEVKEKALKKCKNIHLDEELTNKSTLDKVNKASKSDESYHRRGRLRMKRPEKIERMSAIKGDNQGIIAIQNRPIEPNQNNKECENDLLNVEKKTVNKLSLETSNNKHDTDLAGKHTSLVSPVTNEEDSSNAASETKNDDTMADKKCLQRSEPANMSLRTAPRKSTRLISEIGEEKYPKHDYSENKKSPQKVERGDMSPGSKSPSGRHKKSMSEDLTKADVPEEVETDDLMKQKGVTVNKEGKLMIPSQKLSLSEDLCKVTCGERGKKNFVCQICEKVFMRKDKINYHIYSDHHDEFVRLGKGIPQILTKSDLLNNSDQDIEDVIDDEGKNKINFSDSEDVPLESKKKNTKYFNKQRRRKYNNS